MTDLSTDITHIANEPDAIALCDRFFTHIYGKTMLECLGEPQNIRDEALNGTCVLDIPKYYADRILPNTERTVKHYCTNVARHVRRSAKREDACTVNFV